jgi:hypothetical protein
MKAFRVGNVSSKVFAGWGALGQCGFPDGVDCGYCSINFLCHPPVDLSRELSPSSYLGQLNGQRFRLRRFTLLTSPFARANLQIPHCGVQFDFPQLQLARESALTRDTVCRCILLVSWLS